MWHFSLLHYTLLFVTLRVSVNKTKNRDEGAKARKNKKSPKKLFFLPNKKRSISKVKVIETR
jgi:hypothetical protein